MKKEVKGNQASSLAPHACTDQEVIRKRAFELYLDRGLEDGHAEEDWLRAEEELICMKSESVAA
jgi:hypothetical protein